MTAFFRREAKFMLLWLIWTPVLTLIVGLLAVFLFRHETAIGS
jgi:hypothetical protein